MPCAASITSSAPSQACSERDTSEEKSTWPGVSMKLSSYVCPSLAVYVSVTGCILIVIPRSRSRSIASSICSSIWRCPIVRVISSSRSDSVVFPWLMWAMMQKLRTFAGPFGTATGCGWITGRESSAEASLLQEPPAECLVEEDHDQKGEVEPGE